MRGSYAALLQLCSSEISIHSLTVSELAQSHNSTANVSVKYAQIVLGCFDSIVPEDCMNFPDLQLVATPVSLSLSALRSIHTTLHLQLIYSQCGGLKTSEILA